MVALEIKILVFVGKVFLRIWLIVFFVSIDITVMINILHKTIEIQYEKMFKKIVTISQCCTGEK